MAAGLTYIDYLGDRYSFAVGITSPMPASDQYKYDSLEAYSWVDLSRIESLVIQHSLVDFLLTGSITFIVDYQSLLSSMIANGYLYLKIYFSKVDPNTQKDDPDNTISEIFLVTSSEILEISKSKYIKYKFSFVSIDWWNYIKTLNFNTQGEVQAIDQIMLDAIAASGLRIDTSTINTSFKASSIQLEYNSSANDSLSTILPYLWSKMYVEEEPSSGLKAFTYSLPERLYSMWSLISNMPSRVVTSGTAADVIEFDINNPSFLSMIDPELTVKSVRAQPRTKSYRNIAGSKYSQYDFNTNSFNLLEVPLTTKLNIYNSDWPIVPPRFDDYTQSSPNIIVPNQVYEISQDALNIDITNSDSNHDDTLYEELLNTFIASDPLEVNARGLVYRKPGDVVNLAVNDIIPDVTTNPLQGLIVGLAGWYVITKITHIITPKSYRNDLFLSRNYRIY